MKIWLAGILTVSTVCLQNTTTGAQDRVNVASQNLSREFRGRGDLLAKTLIFEKDFTRVTGLKTPEGLPDYEAAINRHFGKGVSPEQNGAVALYLGLGSAPEGARLSDRFFELLGMQIPPEKGKYFASFGSSLPPDDRSQLVERFTVCCQRPWAEKSFPELAQWLRDNEEPISVITQGAMRPQYFSPLVAPRNADGIPVGLVGSILPGIQQSREIARYLTCRAMMNLEAGNVDDAWQDLMACHRVGEMIVRGPTLIEYLVGTAISQIASQGQLVFLDRVQPAAGQLAQYRQDLASLRPVRPAIAQMMVTERMMYLDSVIQIACGRINVNDLDVSPASGLEELVTQLAMLSINWNTVMHEGNQIYDQFDAAMQLETYAERKAAIQAIEKKLQDVRARVSAKGLLLTAMTQRSPGETVGKMMGGILSSLLLPAFSAVDQAFNRSRQNRENLMLAFALADWKAQNGTYPARLEELVPEFIATKPQDDFSGRPLIYQRTENGFQLYSIGVNEKDDHGRTYGDARGGDDLVIRLPLTHPGD